MKIRLGLIGYGNMGRAHAAAILAGKSPELELVAIADTDSQARADARAQVPEADIYNDGSALIASGKAEAVVIATPHYLHPELAVEAFGQGLHVICEKPAGVYTLQVRRMNEAARKSGKTFAIMLNQRTNCLYRKMKEMLSSGEMGEIKRVNWIITDWYRSEIYYDSSPWKATWKGEGGGVLLNQCPHNLDMVQWLCGMPVKVEARLHYGKWHSIEVEDDVSAYFEFANGATGVFVTSTGDAPGCNRLEITTDRGSLICENNKLVCNRLAVSEREWCFASQQGFDKPPCHTYVVETDGLNPQHVAVMNAFAENILRGEPLVANGEEGLNGLILSNAIHLSDWLGQAVSIPFDEALFLRLLEERQAMSKPKESTKRIAFSMDASYGSVVKEE